MTKHTPIEALKLELAAANVDLADNADFLRGILAGCGDCIKILDLEGRLQFMSDGGKRVMEVDDFNALKGCPWPDFWTGEGNAQAKAAIAAAREGRTARFKNEARTAKGNSRFWDVQVSPIVGEHGQVSNLLSISRDITEEWNAAENQRKYLENQHFLADELTHRVKNTLATVIGIAQQTFRGDIYREARETFDARLHTLAAAYNLLTESSWVESDVRLVIEGAITPYRNGTGKFRIDGPKFSLTPSRALMLALAINELATNAMKYGALSAHEGHVQIRWSEEQIEGVRAFLFEWREIGGPVVVVPTRIGFGSRLIKMLAKEFAGTVDLRYEPSGLICRLNASLG